ncbi:hypothetical protein [Rhizobacter sp. Root1221]|uniref:hypothetical protein n=1 Tax=Rhizobacter sp. Root1221 TaxID=1736433 RepID=UPI0006F45B7A|nr:hypothetical protein [Rhizobacter sp. Root1221]KQV94434.1 hypothetical protein ASC87_26370 [Rhizobacter sp. Root1221]
MASSLTAELASAAARLIVEEGMEYGPAKRRAARVLGRGSVRSAELPDNDTVEQEVRAYLALFCADTQPAELRALRDVAATWMERLQAFRPHLTGAVWRGTATRLNSVHLQLFCDDAKEAEIELLNRRVDFDVGSIDGPRHRPIDVLSFITPSEALGEPVTLHLSILDFDDLRGALKADTRGRTERGDLPALRRLLAEEPA